MSEGIAGLAAVALLEPHHVLPAGIAQGAQLVEPGVHALADEAALAGQQGRLVDQRPADPLRQARGWLEPGRDGAECRLARNSACKRAARSAAWRDRQQVARAAAAECCAGQRPLQVRAAAEQGARLLPQRLAQQQALDGVEPGADGGGVGERGRDALGQEAGAGTGDGAVDRVQERALASAGEAPGQLQVATGGTVDLQDAVGLDPARRRETWQHALLGQLEIVEEGARGRELGPLEAAEAIRACAGRTRHTGAARRAGCRTPCRAAA